EGRRPQVADTAFLAETATLVGDVVIGNECSIWFGAVLRADLGPIRVDAYTNIQDNCVIHSETAAGTTIGQRVNIGHGAVLHDCVVGNGAVIGMNATLLVACKVGDEALIAAGSVVRENDVVPDRMVAAGIPATVKKELGGKAQEFLERGNKDYLYLIRHYPGGDKLPELDYIPEHLK
ncbi:MAG: gamma carbonic anhydrase family protein, partial [Rhodospirillales bacterium]|nr:gamma carbonic anhydrase family protein [Rhodospirillales bacterium]